MKRGWKSRQSLYIAGGLTLLLVLWMLSGQWTGDAPAAQQREAAEERDPRIAVRVRELRAEPVERLVVVSARTRPARSVDLRAEVDGRVLERVRTRGERVRAGEVLVRLDPRDRRERLATARATLRERELEHAAARRLRKEDYQTETQLATAAAALEAARAEVRLREHELEHTEIRAPFDGVLDALPVEEGSYLQAGDPVARVLEMDPLLVAGHVTEHSRPRLATGMPGRARLATGEELEGRIHYLGTEADEGTRTFPVELAVPNPDGAIAAGISAEIHIATASVPGHLLSPALLSLDERGRIGVKTVDAGGQVRFRAVEVVRSGDDGLRVTGLSDPVRVITVGQGYVREGDRVRAVAEATPEPGGG